MNALDTGSAALLSVTIPKRATLQICFAPAGFLHAASAILERGRRMGMDFLSRMTRVVDYIEEHIAEDMDMSEVAKFVCCGAYQFGRIFSYVVGVPLSEYIRRRRLSLAAVELQSGDAKVIDVAMKYGYESPDAFARAFGAMHGVTPREACAPGVKLRLYPRIRFHITIKGEQDMQYRIVEMPAFTVVGVVKNFGRWTANQEGKDWK